VPSISGLGLQYLLWILLC